MSATAVLVASAILLRNPFWPIGYEGEREVISAEPRVVVKAAPEPKEEVQTAKSQSQQESLQKEKEREMKRDTSRTWVAAKKKLRIGGTVRAKQPDGTTRSSVFINGRDYVDNDYVSINHDGNRFTWRVTGLTEKGTLKLERVRSRPLEADKRRLKGAKK